MTSLRTILRAASTCALLYGPAAHASLTIIGNTAPGNRVIDIEISGQLVAQRLGYLEFREIELPPGTVQVRMLDTFTGTALAQADYIVTANPAGWLSLAGEGSLRPHTIVRGSLLSPLDDAGGNLGVVNATGDSIDYSRRCESSDGFSGSTGGGATLFGTVGYSLGNLLDCRVDASARTSLGDVTALPALQLRFQPGELVFLARVGNATTSYPAQWIEVRHGTVSPVTLAAEQDLLRVMKSVHFWYDSGRFSQGVTLYEVSRTQAVNGLWMTYAADGRPQWMYLDGGVVDPSGRREVVVSDYRLDADGRRVGATVGRGVLTYLDCNTAEFQVRFADNSTRAAQFRRSIPVTSCVALP